MVGNADDESIKNKEEQYKNLCRQKNTKLISCCDPNDKKLNNIYDNIDIKLRRKFDKIQVTKKGSKIDSIKVCPSNLKSEELEEENNDCLDYRKATPYEMCKLINSKIKLTLNKNKINKNKYNKINKINNNKIINKKIKNILYNQKKSIKIKK